MSCPFSGKGTGSTRRGLLAGAGGALASVGAATLARAAPQASRGEAQLREPFFGPHQGGIAPPQQTHSYFAAFDCLAKNCDALTTTLKVWTDAAARMSAGETARELGRDVSVEGPDGGSALGLSPGRLTITHQDKGDGWFAFVLHLDHPLGGELISQTGLFRERAAYIAKEPRHD